MSFLIILNAKMKMAQLNPDCKHNERLNKNYSYENTFYAIRENEHLKENLRLTIEKKCIAEGIFIPELPQAFPMKMFLDFKSSKTLIKTSIDYGV